MRKEICNMVEQAITKHEILGKSLDVDNAGYYIWAYNKDQDSRVMVVHGYGNEYEPFEIILISANGGKTVKKQFLNEEEMIRYIKEDMLKELVIFAL